MAEDKTNNPFRVLGSTPGSNVPGAAPAGDAESQMREELEKGILFTLSLIHI